MAKVPAGTTVYIKDVARAAGVSVATVSRVIANADYPVRAETRGRVLAAAEHLGYHPNNLARSLRLGRSEAIGLSAVTLGNPTVISAVEGIIQSSHAASRQVQVTTSFWDPVEEASQLRLFLQQRVAGVISFPSGAPAERYAELQRAGIPVVLINRPVPGLAAPVVRHDFLGGYAKVVEALTRRGHRRIGAILPGNVVDKELHAGAWRAAFLRLGLQAPLGLVRQAPFDALADRPAVPEEGVHASVRELLSVPNPPTALFTASVTITLAAIRAIDDAGLRVPADVALVGTGDQRWDVLFTPRIPSLCLDSFSLGTQAAELVGALIRDPYSVKSDFDVAVEMRLENVELLSAATPAPRITGGVRTSEQAS